MIDGEIKVGDRLIAKGDDPDKIVTVEAVGEGRVSYSDGGSHWEDQMRESQFWERAPGMPPEQAIERLRNLSGGCASEHVEAEEILCELLVSLGCKDVAEAFIKAGGCDNGFWYE